MHRCKGGAGGGAAERGAVRREAPYDGCGSLGRVCAVGTAPGSGRSTTHRGARLPGGATDELLAEARVDPWVRNAALIALATLLAACGAAAAPREPTWAELALAVWERGHVAIPPPLIGDGPERLSEEEVERLMVEDPWNSDPFRDFDEQVRAFLKDPWLEAAVSFSCARVAHSAEDWITSGLDDQEPAVRARALVVLLQVHAPRSVARQWAVLQEFERTCCAEGSSTLFAALRSAFAPDALDSMLRDPSSSAFPWAVRAAGVSGHWSALPLLTELSCSVDRYHSWIAQKSLSEFSGRAADAALAECVRAWTDRTAECAARALVQRDPELLRSVLLTLDPNDRPHRQGELLAQLEDPRAVPLLCAGISQFRFLDEDAFRAIARLATEEHLEEVRALPERVREGRRQRAEAVVGEVEERVGR